MLLAESFQNNGKTHSATLMPMAERLLSDCGVKPMDLDYIAVAKGPGSFTGVRIGVSAAKGLGWAAEKPLIGVSTLEAMTFQLRHLTGIILPVMDARRSQVYNAVFSSDGTVLTRLTADRAISLAELKPELQKIKTPIFLVGDGSRLCYNTLGGDLECLVMPPPHLEQQRAAGVAMAAFTMTAQSVPSSELQPNYLRLSQAERERLSRIEKEQQKGDS